MKKIVYGLIVLVTAIQLMVSCSADSDVLSQFSKRKYLKKYKAKDNHEDPSVENRELHLAFNTPNHNDVIVASTQAVVEETKVNPQSNEMETAVLNLSANQVNQLEKISSGDLHAWNNYNRDYNYFHMNPEHAEMVIHNKNTKASTSRASDIVIALLCFFLPPIGVVVYENGVTGNFWLDLVLTILFWLPGAVYAFLVCFADVSI